MSAIIPKGAEEIPEFGDLPKNSGLINKLSKLKQMLPGSMERVDWVSSKRIKNFIGLLTLAAGVNGSLVLFPFI